MQVYYSKSLFFQTSRHKKTCSDYHSNYDPKKAVKNCLHHDKFIWWHTGKWLPHYEIRTVRQQLFFMFSPMPHTVGSIEAGLQSKGPPSLFAVRSRGAPLPPCHNHHKQHYRMRGTFTTLTTTGTWRARSFGPLEEQNHEDANERNSAQAALEKYLWSY